MAMKYVKRNAMHEFSNMILNSLKEAESDKNLKWIKPWSTICSNYRNAFTKREYSGLHNILVCALSEFSDPRYATFNQVRQNGGKVKQGSKATNLIAWRFGKVKQDDGTEKSIPFATIWSVFNVEQIEGIEFEKLVSLNEDIQPNEIVMDIYKSLDVQHTIKISNTAAYNPVKDTIVIPDHRQFNSSSQFSNTCLHELVHWTAKRVNRDCSSYSFDVEARAMEELVAELGAMYLSMKLKIDGYMDQQNIIYIKQWKSAANAKGGDRFFYKACKLAEEASNYILSAYKPNDYSQEEVEEEVLANE